MLGALFPTNMDGGKVSSYKRKRSHDLVVN